MTVPGNTKPMCVATRDENNNELHDIIAIGPKIPDKDSLHSNGDLKTITLMSNKETESKTRVRPFTSQVLGGTPIEVSLRTECKQVVAIPSEHNNTDVKGYSNLPNLEALGVYKPEDTTKKFQLELRHERDPTHNMDMIQPGFFTKFYDNQPLMEYYTAHSPGTAAVSCTGMSPTEQAADVRIEKDNFRQALASCLARMTLEMSLGRLGVANGTQLLVKDSVDTEPIQPTLGLTVSKFDKGKGSGTKRRAPTKPRNDHRTTKKLKSEETEIKLKELISKRQNRTNILNSTKQDNIPQNAPPNTSSEPTEDNKVPANQPNWKELDENGTLTITNPQQTITENTMDKLKRKLSNKKYERSCPPQKKSKKEADEQRSLEVTTNKVSRPRRKRKKSRQNSNNAKA